MKTKVMQDKRYRYDILLTVSGWALAIFISLLYLNDASTTNVVPVQPEPVRKKAPVLTTETRTDRADSLLLESRILLSRNRPIETINRITTLWSVCHSNQQEVPEESHRLFAQAVSLLSRNRNGDNGPLPHLEHSEKERPAPSSAFKKNEDGTGDIKPMESSSTGKEPKLTIPTPDYPRVKIDSKASSHHYPEARRHNPPPPPATAEEGRRPPAFPPPPGRNSDDRLPAPPPHPGGGRHPGPHTGNFPPPPPPPSAPGRGQKRDPLDAGAGGSPPGYYY